MSSEIFLLDPCGQIRSLLPSASLPAALREHVRVDTYLREIELATAPAVAVLDMTGLRYDEISSLRDRRFSDLLLRLVCVQDVEDGASWLENGAHDFVVIPGREKELEARLTRLIEHRNHLVEPRNQGSLQNAFLRQLAHELKNPLNAISGYAELLLMEETLDSQSRVDVGRILRNASLLQSTIESAVACGSDESVEDAPEVALEPERS